MDHWFIDWKPNPLRIFTLLSNFNDVTSLVLEGLRHKNLKPPKFQIDLTTSIPKRPESVPPFVQDLSVPRKSLQHVGVWPDRKQRNRRGAGENAASFCRWIHLRFDRSWLLWNIWEYRNYAHIVYTYASFYSNFDYLGGLCIQVNASILHPGVILESRDLC